MKYQEVADQVHANAGHARSSAGAVTPHSGPRSMAEVEAHTAEVARTTAQRARALRSPKGIVYADDTE
jgi:hypothetical protein